MRVLAERLLAASLCLVTVCGCDAEVENGRVEVDRRLHPFPQFQNEVYPVLIRDCGFDTCHGASGRFLRIWGPGRVRLPREMDVSGAFDEPTLDEISITYNLALAMIDARAPERSPLLRKPLAVEAGGAGHLGVDAWGRDVYRTPQDDGYVVLRRWVVPPVPTTAPDDPAMDPQPTTP